MAVRVFVRSTTAVVVAFLGGVAIVPLVFVGWLIAAAYGATGLATDPAFLGGFGRLVYVAIAGGVAAVAALLWLPFGAGIAYAVGRATRGRSASLRATVSRVLDNLEDLARWAKTRVAIGPLADPLLSEGDVHPNEIAAGCAGFVVPALVLDAPDLPKAVERANRVPPEATRGLVALVPLASTIVVVGGVLAWGVLPDGPLPPPLLALAVAVGVLGGVVIATLDAAWRANVYAAADTADGFRSR